MNEVFKRDILRARVIIALTFLGLLLVCAANVWLFGNFYQRSYLEWYARTGPLIAIATAAFGAAWGGLDKNPALVSANPLAYLGACFQVAGLPLVAAGAHLRPRHRLTPVGLELVPAMVLTLALTVAVFAWLLLIVPAQYFLFLVSGSLSRIALTSSAQISSRIRDGQVELVETEHSVMQKSEGGWWDASMRYKPVTLASAFGAALLFLASAIMA